MHQCNTQTILSATNGSLVMLVELAIGDAYGAGFEYVRDRRFINSNNDLTGYIKNPKHLRKSGNYTDDTQMSIAIAELIVEKQIWTPENCSPPASFSAPCQE